MNAGGFWRCAVRKRATSRRVDSARRDAKNQKTRERYDTNPVYRIEKLLHDSARKRRATLERRHAAHAREEGS